MGTDQDKAMRAGVAIDAWRQAGPNRVGGLVGRFASTDTRGASFLSACRDAALETAAWHADAGGWRVVEDADYDEISEVADAVVPVYTAALWETFTDLGAWDVDTSDYGDVYDADMTRQASIVLYIIAESIIREVLEDIAVQVRGE
jgi:hypothetical protein